MKLIGTHTAAFIAVFVAAVIAGCGTSTPEALLASGKEYLAKGDKTAAVIQLKNALQQKPNLAEARFLLGKTLLDSGDVAGAEKELRKAMEFNYPAEHVIPPLARSLALLGQHKQLTEEFSKAEVSTPEGKAELQTALGKAYLALGDVAKARAAFNVAVAAQADYAPAQLGAAQAAAISRDFPKALALVESVVKTTPKYSEAWYVKADIHLAQGQREAALDAYRKSVEAQHDFLSGHSAIVSLLIREDKLQEAAKQLEAMTEIAPNHSQTLYLRALLAYRQRNLVAARQAIQQQLNVLPNHLPSLALAGGIEYELKSYALAESYLLKVLQRAPEHSLSRRLLILTYLRSGEPGKALNALKPDLDRINKDPRMLAVAGETFLMNGDHAQAAAYFAKAAALDPTDTANRTALAITLVAKGDTERGLRELEQTAADDAGIRADLALIAAHMQRREYDKALKAIATFEKKQPTNPAPHNLRGAVLVAKKDVPAARRSFERAVELNATYFPAVANLARLDLAEKKPDAARQRFEAVLAKEPNQREALLALAEIRARDGTVASSEVVALFSRVISANPNDADARLSLISYYLRTKEVKKAVTAAQEALAAMPNRPEIMDAAGRAYQAAGEINQALSVYSKLASLQPTSPHPHLRMAQLHLAAKDKEAASADFRKALNLQPDHVGAQRGAIALDLESGRQAQALATARQVQKQRPKEAIGYVLEGDIYAAAKQWTEAADAYRRGLKESGSADLAIRLHDAFIVSGNPARAEQFAATWFKEHPKDQGLRLHLAQTAMVQKDFEAATRHYRKLLDSQSNNALVLNNLAWASAHVGDPKAIEYAEQANKLAPEQPAIMDTLGILLVQKGDTARGLEFLKKAAALAPQVPEIRLNLARAQLKAGQKDAARKELDELSKLGDKFPRHAEVKQLRQGL